MSLCEVTEFIESLSNNNITIICKNYCLGIADIIIDIHLLNIKKQLHIIFNTPEEKENIINNIKLFIFDILADYFEVNKLGE